MKMLACFTLLCCIIAVSGPAYCQTSTPDLKITVRQTSLGHSSQTTLYWSCENSRSERLQSESGVLKGHHQATIQRRGTDKIRVYELDLDAKKYVSYQTDLRGAIPHPKPVAIKPSGKTLVIDISSEDTGERKEMFGLQARHMIIREKRVAEPDSCYQTYVESVTDGWYVDYDIFPQWQRPSGDGFAVGIVGGHACSDKIEVHRSGPRPGYPLLQKTTFTNQGTQPDGTSRTYTSTSESEVLGLSQGPIDPRLFAVPKGFKRVDSLADATK